MGSDSKHLHKEICMLDCSIEGGRGRKRGGRRVDDTYFTAAEELQLQKIRKHLLHLVKLAYLPKQHETVSKQ